MPSLEPRARHKGNQSGPTVPDGARQTSETGGIGLYYVEEWKRQSERIAPSGLIEGFSDAGGLEGPGPKKVGEKIATKRFKQPD